METPEAVLVDSDAYRSSVRGSVVDVFKYRELLRNLVAKDLKLKYRGSFFGFLWSLVNPLVMIVVYMIAFTRIMGMRSEGFVFLLLIGILAWTFFASSTSMAAGSIVDNGGLLKSVYFPRAVLPLGSVLFNLVQFLLTMAVFLPLVFAVFAKVPQPPVFLFPVFLLLQLALTVGVALMVATGTAFFRDIRHLVEIALMVLFWTTPILYELKTVPDPWRTIVLPSPVSPFVIAYKDIFYYGQIPAAEVWAVASAYSVAALVGGTLMFSRLQDHFVEQV